MGDGTLVRREVLAVSPRMAARADVLAGLGLRAAQHPAAVGEYIPADPAGHTDVPGVWVAGNVTDLTAQVGGAAAAGALAGAHINADLVAEETRRAVGAYRDAFTPRSETATTDTHRP
jgi:thioredoxin reductase